MDDQKAIRFAPDSCQGRISRFRFHDDEELGPVMLSRIAKRTGLTAEDL
jgi:hypothetical protein